MMKKLTVLGIAVAMLFSLTACSRLPVVYAECEGDSNGTYKSLGINIMNTGETLTISQNTFNGVDSNVKTSWSVGKFDKFELFTFNETNKGIVTIKDNTITAVNSGHTWVYANVYINGKDPSGRKVMLKWTVAVAEISVINEATMTPITTAQELADINNTLSGHYILKADIDLKEWGEWKSIGEKFPGFTGMLVNPYGYKIRNLTVTTSETMFGEHVGLFGAVSDNAFISGIILENIFIDVSDYEGIASVEPSLVGGIWPFGSPTVGGIAAEVGNSAMIMDCSVSGTIIGGGTFTGGIAGTANNVAWIINCTFTGTLKNHKSILDQMFAIGGIVGYSDKDYDKNTIINCSVNADIDGGKHASAGGIIGSINSFGEAINSSFIGTVISERSAGTMVGYEKRSDGPINFD